MHPMTSIMDRYHAAGWEVGPHAWPVFLPDELRATSGDEQGRAGPAQIGGGIPTFHIRQSCLNCIKINDPSGFGIPTDVLEEERPQGRIGDRARKALVGVSTG